MSKIPQSAYAQPAFVSDYRFHVGLPVISSNYLGYENSSFRYSDIIQRREDDSLFVNMDNLIDQLGSSNYIKVNLQIDLLNVGFRTGDNYFSFRAREIIHSEFLYPDNLVALFWEGNAKFLGQRASLDGLGYNFKTYREYGFGFAREINERFTLGVTVKFLNGMENIQTVESRLGLTTDEETYALTVDGTAEFRTSGVRSLADFDFNYTDRLFSYSNAGFGLDFGFRYQINDRVNISAAVNDIGFINWNSDVASYAIRDTSFTFEGIHLNDMVNQQEENVFQNLIDSLGDTFFPEEDINAYRTHLRTFMYVGANYQVVPKHQLGILAHSALVDRKVRPAFTLNWVGDFTDWLSASATYSIYGGSYANFGAGLAVKVGPVQLYGVSDNVTGLLAPFESYNWHFRFGMNLLFGKIEDE